MKSVRVLLPIVAACAITATAGCGSPGQASLPRHDPVPSKAWALLEKDHRQQGRVTDFQPGALLDLRLDDGTTSMFELDFAPPVIDEIRPGDRVQVRWFDLWMIMPPSPNESKMLIATATAIRTNGDTKMVTLRAPTGESLTITGVVVSGDADLSFLKPGDPVHVEHSVGVQEITKVPR